VKLLKKPSDYLPLGYVP